MQGGAISVRVWGLERCLSKALNILFCLPWFSVLRVVGLGFESSRQSPFGLESFNL